MTYKELAALVASKLDRSQLIDLAEMLDQDAGNDFCFFIQEECCKIAPELYGDPEGYKPTKEELDLAQDARPWDDLDDSKEINPVIGEHDV